MDLQLHTKLKGLVRFYEGSDWRKGRLLWERENLVVNSGLTALANLLGGTTAGEFVAIIGYGSGSTAPSAADVALTATPTYYKAISVATIGPSGGVAAGSVQFSYSLLTTDYAANPLTIQELGLFGNTGSANFPAAIGTGFPAFQTSHTYSIGDLLVDSNNNIQRCTTGGTSGSAPTWATTIGATSGTTPQFTLVALHTAPVPMVTHVTVPAFPYTGGGNYSGTWTISM